MDSKQLDSGAFVRFMLFREKRRKTQLMSLFPPNGNASDEESEQTNFVSLQVYLDRKETAYLIL